MSDFVKNCKDFESCKKGIDGCRGCNVWNYLHDIEALKRWSDQQGLDFAQTTMAMHKKLAGEK